MCPYNLQPLPTDASRSICLRINDRKARATFHPRLLPQPPPPAPPPCLQILHIVHNDMADSGHHTIYSCKCLNVQLKTSPAPSNINSPEVTGEDGFTSVYVGETGIDVVRSCSYCRVFPITDHSDDIVLTRLGAYPVDHSSSRSSYPTQGC